MFFLVETEKYSTDVGGYVSLPICHRIKIGLGYVSLPICHRIKIGLGSALMHSDGVRKVEKYVIRLYEGV